MKKKTKEVFRFKKMLTGISMWDSDDRTISSDFKNIEIIAEGSGYGEIFKCWNDDPKKFVIYFGRKPLYEICSWLSPVFKDINMNMNN